MKSQIPLARFLIAVLLAGCSASQPAATVTILRPTPTTDTLAAEMRYAASLIQLVLDISESATSARNICVAHEEAWAKELNLRRGWLEPKRSEFVESAVKQSVVRQQAEIDKLTTTKNAVQNAIRGLPSPPPERLKPAYAKFLQLHSQYAILVALAGSPRGALSYDQEVQAAIRAFNLIKDELYVLFPSY